MKKIFFALLYSVILVNILTGTDLFKTKCQTIVSDNEIISFTDPFTGMIWGESDIKGSLIASWTNGAIEEARGFCNIVLYTSYPDGGKFEISLLYVTYSDTTTIQGVWAVKKTGYEEIFYKWGTITDLNYPIGYVVELNLGEAVLKARISFTCAFSDAQPEIKGQIKKNQLGLNDALVSLKQKNSDEEDIFPTYGNGDYKFIVTKPENLDRLTIHFSNTEPAYFSGHVYLLGMPWKKAGVDILINSRLVNTTTTDDDGFFEFSLVNEPAAVKDISVSAVDVIISMNQVPAGNKTILYGNHFD